MKKLETTEELTDFTAAEVKKSKLTVTEISNKLGISIKSTDHGISKGQRSNPGRNSVRRKILGLFGYDVNTVFIVKKRTKKVE